MKTIAGVVFLSRDEAAEFLSTSLSTLDGITHKARTGKAKHPIPFLQWKKNSPVMYPKEKLTEWILDQVK